jgi:hypothetical protein
LDPQQWNRIEKDLYLKTGWASSAFVHFQRKKEGDLLPTDKVVVDVKVLGPGVGPEQKWESRSAGIWLLRSAKHHASDSQMVITAVDVLFGSDAVDPRPNWEIIDFPLLLDSGSKGTAARLSFRRGSAQKIDRPVPRIRKDGKFKIMQVSDLHLSTGLGTCRDPVPALTDISKCEADPRTLEFVEKLVEEEKPDLVILSGDQVNGKSAPDAQTAVFKSAEIFIRHRIPYAAIFGNHDDEGNLNRMNLMDLMKQLPYSLSEPGPVDVDGVGNYIVEILGRGITSNSALTLYLLDTHSYTPDEHQYPGYDWLRPSQIKWFKDTAQGLQSAHGDYAHTHMNLAFIHIPLPEYRNRENAFKGGNWSERPTAPVFNSHFKDALVDESVLLVSCGQ